MLVSSVRGSALRVACAGASVLLRVFFFTATATTEIYTLSLHDALPISAAASASSACAVLRVSGVSGYSEASAASARARTAGDRKSTRLNSSHSQISYAVFCLKKKKEILHYPELHHHLIMVRADPLVSVD